jgi:mono/diheme cytochrome c family protein
MAEPADLALFVGRFHIVLLHLPIGFLLLAAVLELLARQPWFKDANHVMGYVLALAVPVAFATAACGWLLASGSEYDPELLWWHRWLGVAAAVGSLATALLQRRVKLGPYHVSLIVTVTLLLAASHFGGSLTHGKEFLTEHAPRPVRKYLRGNKVKRPAADTRTLQQRPVFGAVILPVLDRTCVPCHGPEKAKGKLRLDTYEALVKGGDAGPVIIPGKAGESELLKRILLPASHDDHMPPAGKPQPTDEDIALLTWWIDTGSPADKTLEQLAPGAAVLRMIEARTAAAVQTNSPPK